MMYKKLYEIEGFDNGVKVRHKNWNENCYIYFYVTYDGFNCKKGTWLDEYGKLAWDGYFKYFHKPVWEVYQDPNEKKKGGRMIWNLI